jgi:DNA-binding NarL/FixJ family response regulator
MHLSHHTVKEHVSSLYRKLGVRNRTGAVHRARRLGLIA